MGVRSEDRSANISAAVKAALLEGVAAAGAYVEGRAKELCPVDTGTLRRSIHTELQTQAKPGETHAFVGTSLEYAKYVEFGTSRMRAQPFVRPAFDETKGELPGIIREFVTEAIIVSAGKSRLR